MSLGRAPPLASLRFTTLFAYHDAELRAGARRFVRNKLHIGSSLYLRLDTSGGYCVCAPAPVPGLC